MQKFKLLATQCAVVGSPTRSPTTSPVIHIRRRKTLRMLLGRGSGGSNAAVFHRQHHSPDNRRRNNNSGGNDNAGNKESNLGARLKLKDLFVSSPPPARKVREEEEGQRLLPAAADGDSAGGLAIARRAGDGGRGLRPLSATLRQRLLRRAWRPVLVGIPEQSPISGCQLA